MTHSTWFKRCFNPILRRLLGVEICSIVADEIVIGYGVRKCMVESKEVVEK